MSYLAVIGSRELSRLAPAVTQGYTIIRGALEAMGPDVTVVSGGAAGPDTWADDIGQNMDLNTIVFEADWSTHGKKAGFLRNQEIVALATHLLALWDGHSKGTKHSLDLAVQQGIPTVAQVWDPIKRTYMRHRLK